MREVRRGRRALAALAAALTAWAGTAPAGAQGMPRDAAADSAWVQGALAHQYELGGDLGFRDAPWVGTHNSFNSTAEMGQTLSASDSNQRITIRDQLDQGIRSIELDLHYFPSLEGGGFTTVVCHARDSSEGNAGCTVEKTFDEVLAGLAAWLADHPDQVLLLYLEDDMDTAPGYEDAGETLDARIGQAIHRPAPPAEGCQELPMDLTRDQVRAAGKQVVIVTDCGSAASWRGAVFTWDDHLETGIDTFSEFPGCGSDFTREQYDSALVRYYEDSTALSEAIGDPGEIDELTAAQLARCGVELTGLDQLAHGDPRLAAMVWSWAPGQPAAGRCSEQRVGEGVPFGRWRSTGCAGKRRSACLKPNGRWKLTPPVELDRAAARCERGGATFSVPRTGYEAQLLRLAMQRRGARGARLAQVREGGAWAALDARG
jgi:hypothetical protein